MKRRKRMNKIIQLGNLRKDTKNFTNPQTGRIYSAEGIAPTLNTCQGGNLQPFIIERKINEKDSV